MLCISFGFFIVMLVEIIVKKIYPEEHCVCEVADSAIKGTGKLMVMLRHFLDTEKMIENAASTSATAVYTMVFALSGSFL